ncbi:hypothetical protein IMK15_00865 [Sneathia sp. DSM 16631]|uniref:hypothetical protein n=1 Tax=Sneathia TaxID=168808 RepID=UPI001867B880|nr:MULTISPECIES: hypothetical protein [Sneathia]MBE3030536.1 hypothetical protein [Sneathia sp. DSM 16631]MDK9582117.1 hypothetical protein [Sneathia vaginalis]
MKKLIVLLSTLITILSFSFVNGTYSAKKSNGSSTSEMTIICRNGKIMSVSFDEKMANGNSLKLSDNFFANQTLSLSQSIRERNTIDGVKIDLGNNNYSSDFKELFRFLEDKAKKGEVGSFRL